MTRAHQLLEALVRVESLSGAEAEAADVLSRFVERAGLTVQREDNNVWFSLGGGDGAVAAAGDGDGHGRGTRDTDGPGQGAGGTDGNGPSDADTLLLNSHLDVVPPSEGHPYPPFEPTVVDGALYGRGAVDAKGSVAAMTTAVLELHAEGWTPPPGGRLLAAFTACEERGWPYNGLESTRPRLEPIAAAIVGEPTELKPCSAQKGLLILRVDAKGKSAHAARPELGRNAIEMAARDVLRAVALKLDRVHPVLGPVTVAPTVIEGGTVRNKIPDTCSFYLDIRTTPSYTHDELIARFNEALECHVHVHSSRLIPADTASNERIIQAARAASGQDVIGSPTASDWIFLADIPTVKMGPGRSPLSHTAEEHLLLAELERAVDVYKRTIVGYFST